MSACNSASVRDFRLLDESIHLAAAIQLAGYPAVVATLWQVSDEYSSKVAKDVYGRMLGENKCLNPQLSAEGLHWAMRRFRDITRAAPGGFTKESGNDPLLWASYIHIGV